MLGVLGIVLPYFLTKELYDYVKNNGDLMLLYYMAVFWLFVLVCIAFAVIRINRKIQVGRFKNKVYVLYDASQNESSLLWLCYILFI